MFENSAMLNNISMYFMFKGVAPSTDLLPEKSREGDIYIVGDTPYLYSEGKYMKMGSIDDDIESNKEEDETKQKKQYYCECCGAPIAYLQETCDYCDSAISWVK